MAVVTGTSVTDPALPAPADVPAAAVAPPADPHATAPEGRRLVLLAYVAGFAVVAALVGLDRTLGVVAGLLNVVFGALLLPAPRLRHGRGPLGGERPAGRRRRAGRLHAHGRGPRRLQERGARRRRHGHARCSRWTTRPTGSRLVVVDDGSDRRHRRRGSTRWAAGDRRLRVLHRPAGSGGGKSGALNDAAGTSTRRDRRRLRRRPRARTATSLRRLVRHFQDPKVGAVQGRCVVRNSGTPRWPDRSRSTTSPATSSTSTAGRRCSSCPRTAGPTAPCATSTLRRARRLEPRQRHRGHRPDPARAAGRRAGALRHHRRRHRGGGGHTLSRFWTQRYRWARGHQQVLARLPAAVLRTPAPDAGRRRSRRRCSCSSTTCRCCAGSVC